MPDDRLVSARRNIDLLVGRLDGDGASDPLVAACLACLDAADSLCAALDAPSPLEACQEALHATRAATLAIRFALVAEGDRARDAR